MIKSGVASVKNIFRTLLSFFFFLFCISSSALPTENLSNKSPLSFPKACTELKSANQEENYLRSLYSKKPEKFKKALQNFIAKNNNVGGDYFAFPHKKIVLRSSLLSKNPGCLKALTKKFDLKSILYLYDGGYVDEKNTTAREEELFKKAGGQFFIHDLSFSDKLNKQTGENINQKITNTIMVIKASPKNVLIHCIGGWHRTGVIYGVLQKCINHEDMNTVIKEYQTHTGWKKKELPGLYLASDIDIIKNYPCSMLEAARN